MHPGNSTPEPEVSGMDWPIAGMVIAQVFGWSCVTVLVVGVVAIAVIMIGALAWGAGAVLASIGEAS